MKKESKVYFKEIVLLPIHIKMHAWIVNDQERMAQLFHEAYGAEKEYYYDEITPFQVCVISSTDDSKFKGERIIVLNILKLDLKVLVHEINHVFYKLNKMIGQKMTQSNQEWHSYMLEHLYDQLDKLDKYTKL